MEDDDPQMICKVTGSYCIRAFCEDYGCANELALPVDEYDTACGSDEPIPPLYVKRVKRRNRDGQKELF